MDEEGDLVTDFHRNLDRGRKSCSQLLNVHGVKDVRQTEIHTAEPLVPQPSALEFELAIEKLRCHKLQDIYQIPTRLIKVGGRKIRCEFHKLIISI
jgi:hypothetical protein